MVALLDPPRAGRSGASTNRPISKLQRKRARKLARWLYGSASEWRQLVKVVPRFIDQTPQARAARTARRQQTQARAHEHQRQSRANRLLISESETLLTERERKRIREIILKRLLAGRRVPLHLLDYRFWELRRRLGWKPLWKCAQWKRVYFWWISLDVATRQILAECSRGAGMRDLPDQMPEAAKKHEN